MKRVGLAVLLLSIGLGQPVWAQDVTGAHDHPMLTRYPQSVIKWYDVQTFMPYKIGVAKVGGYRKIDDWVETTGKVTRIYYELSGERTHADVYANYKKALNDAGFKLMADGFQAGQSVSPEIGSRNWLTIYYAANTLPPGAGVELLHGTATSGGSAFLAGQKMQAGMTVYVAIGVTQQRADRVTYLIDVIEAGEAETGLVTIDAEAMGKGIDQYGKVALYGLYFDHDKAVLKPESKPALVEIAKLLKARPKLNVYVVGHTDSTGAFSHNLKLSQDRGRAIVDALVKEYGIASARLEPHGVASLAPVAANRSDGERAKNRRVELVER